MVHVKGGVSRIYYPSTYGLCVQMILPKHVLVQTQDRNNKLELLQYMSHSLFCIHSHIINDILFVGWMDIVWKHQECLFMPYESYKEWRSMWELT